MLQKEEQAVLDQQEYNMPFQFDRVSIEGVILITPKVFKDDRGHFFETYKFSEFDYNVGLCREFVQDNQSYSTKNVLRGIHFQKNPRPQGKLVRCVRGSIRDVAVDLRPNSPTFKKWISFELNEFNKKMLYIPEGFGHGFLTLTEEAEICYKCTAEYDKNLDGGIIWNDPDIGVEWGTTTTTTPILSDKDTKLPTLNEFMK